MNCTFKEISLAQLHLLFEAKKRLIANDDWDRMGEFASIERDLMTDLNRLQNFFKRQARNGIREEANDEEN